MNEQERTEKFAQAMNNMIQEAAKWKSRALAACFTACYECREYSPKRKCYDGCEVKKILVEEGIYETTMQDIEARWNGKEGKANG